MKNKFIICYTPKCLGLKINMKYWDKGWNDILDRMAWEIKEDRKTGVKDDTVAFGLSNWMNRVHYMRQVGLSLGSNIKKYWEVLDLSLIFSMKVK